MVKIGSNIASLNAQRRLSESTNTLSGIFERLASGQRINRASDDAAGLAISENLRAQSRVYGQAVRNVNDGVSVLNIAQGALTELTGIVTRQKELAIQSLNGTYSNKQRKALDQESDALTSEYNRIVQATAANGVYLLDGHSTEGMRIQAGFGVNGSLNVLLGNEMGDNAGSGQFTDGSNISGVTSDDIVSDDINGDGFADLITTSAGTTQLIVRLNNGSGQFSVTQTINTSNQLAQLILKDVDEDGKLDLVSSDLTTNDIVVLRGNGDGTFQSGTSFSSGANGNERFGDSALADLNGDGNLDFVKTGANMIAVSLGDGHGSFAAYHTFATGIVTAGKVSVGDVDGDGKLDLAVSVAAGLTYDVQIMTGRGDGTFSAGAINSFNPGVAIGDIALADLNKDGRAELIVSEINSHSITVITDPNGTGTRTSFITPGGNRGGRLMVKDFNNDGYLDAAQTDWDTSKAYIFLNNNQGTFTSATSAAISTGYYGATAADFNGDGTIDIIGGGLNTTTFNTVDTTRRNNRLDYLDLDHRFGAAQSIRYLDRRLESLGKEMGALGAFQSRLEAALSNISSTKVNLDAADSLLRDADIASDSAKLVRTQILQQAAASILSHANQEPALALRLLAGN